jgi:hypothetical protein
MATKYARRTENLPNGQKKHLPVPDPPKFTQIGILGLKINHLTALFRRKKLFFLRHPRKKLIFPPSHCESFFTTTIDVKKSKNGSRDLLHRHEVIKDVFHFLLRRV